MRRIYLYQMTVLAILVRAILAMIPAQRIARLFVEHGAGSVQILKHKQSQT